MYAWNRAHGAGLAVLALYTSAVWNLRKSRANFNRLAANHALVIYSTISLIGAG